MINLGLNINQSSAVCDILESEKALELKNTFRNDLENKVNKFERKSNIKYSNTALEVIYEKKDFEGFIMSLICANQIKIGLPYEINLMNRSVLAAFIQTLAKEHISNYPPNRAVFERLGKIVGFKYVSPEGFILRYDDRGDLIN